MLTPPIGAAVALAALAGLCFAPITVCQNAAINEVAADASKAEAFSWLATAYGTGAAAGAVLAGQLTDASHVRAVFATACAATALSWLFAAVRLRDRRPVAA